MRRLVGGRFVFIVCDVCFPQEMQAHIDKINEMASVMKKAIEVDEGRLCEDEERIKQLEVKANGPFLLSSSGFSEQFYTQTNTLKPASMLLNSEKMAGERLLPLKLDLLDAKSAFACIERVGKPARVLLSLYCPVL